MSKDLKRLIWTMVLTFNLILPIGINAQTRQVVLEYIKVNGETLEGDDRSDVYISSNDTITFGYRCDSDGTDKTPFLFRLRTKFDGQENVQTLNTTSLTYSGLSDGDYFLSIDAFGNKWTANPAILVFHVNNKQASMRRELKHLRSEVGKLDSLKKDSTASIISINGIDFVSVALGFLISLLLFGIVLVVIRKNQKPNDDKQLTPSGKQDMSQDTISISKEQHDRLVAENSNLRAEISALRGQIDAMQTRGDELIKQNNELKETVERLNKSQKEFEELQKQKDELFAIIIHDLKNPVALVKSLVELLRSYDLTVNEQKEIINDIFETTTKIVALSQEVTKILALESSSLNMKYETVQINEIITSVHHRNQIAANNKSIEVLLDLSEIVPESSMDPQKIEEIIDNLLSNAVKFSHKNGQVRIKSHRSDDNIVVEISDNGLGLSEDDIKQAFQRGGRLSAQPTAGEPSSGFGLWIVKKLVEAHRGRVWVKSALGKGSTFAFSLPIVIENTSEE